MYGTNAAHGGAILAMNTGSDRFVRPSMGSWISYGLGTENENLPAFITICPSYQHGGVQNYSAAFLPAAYNGTAIGQHADEHRRGDHRLPGEPGRQPGRAAGRGRPAAALAAPPARSDGPRPGPRGAHRVVRARVPHANRGPRADERRGRVRGYAEAVWPGRPGGGRLRPAVPAGAALLRVGRALRAGHPRARQEVGPPLRADHGAAPKLRRDRPAGGRAHHRPQAARPAGRDPWCCGGASSGGRRGPRRAPATAATTTPTATPCSWPGAA